MKKHVAICLIAGGCLVVGACSNDSGDSEGGKGGDVGHCTTAEQCFEVTMPADYDLAFECSLSKGTPGAGPCDASMYDLTCTEVSQVTINDGPEQDVTYVYYRPADGDLFCAGVEMDL